MLTIEELFEQISELKHLRMALELTLQPTAL